MNFRRPDAQLANCCWFPRLIDKARAYQAGKIPTLYKVAFGSRFGIDGYFFRHFGLTKADCLQAINECKDDSSMKSWFTALDLVTEDSIAEWNALAPALGSEGHAGYIKLVYPKSVRSSASSIFEAILQDEATEKE